MPHPPEPKADEWSRAAGENTPPANMRFGADWLPERCRSPVFGYLAAVVLQGAAIALTWLLMQRFPSFLFATALPLLALAVVALFWGVWPGLLAMVLGVVLIDYFLLPASFSLSLTEDSLVGLLIFILVSLVILRLASQSEQARRAAGRLVISLMRERARLEAIFEAIPNTLSIHDQQGTLIQTNAAGRHGRTATDLPVLLEALPDFYQIRTPQGEPVLPEQLPVARALRGETVNGVELCIPDAAGNDRLLLTGAAPIRDHRGQIEGAVGLAHDITALRLVEQQAERHRRQLQAIQTLTDTALTHLELDDLLHEMLGRLSEVMETDNAAILLMREDGQMLVMRAEHGLEEEVADRVYVPVGRGFAGRIAASRQPMIVPDTRAFDVFNPFLRERLRSVVGVPLLLGERVLGVVHVGTATPRQFTQEDVQLLQRAADRIALAVDRTRLYADAQAARKEAEQRARELETAFESMTDGLVIFDREGRLLQMNTAARAILGLDLVADYTLGHGSPGSSRFQVRSERGQPLGLADWPISRILRGETLTGTGSVDLLVRSLNGREFQVSVSGAPVRDQAGQIIGAVSVFRDVTERRRLERRTQEALEALLETAHTLVQQSLPDAPALADGRGGLQMMARRLAALACKVLGSPRAAFRLLDPTTNLWHPLAVVGLNPEEEQQWDAGEDPSIPSEVEAQLRADETVVFEMQPVAHLGVPNPYRVRQALLVPLRVGQHLLGLLSLDYKQEPHIFTPQERALAGAVGQLAALVLERERLLHEREEQRARVLALTEANRRMDEFLGIAGHELRTPLTKIKASIQLAEHRLLAAQRQQAMPADSAQSKAFQQALEMIGRAERNVEVINRLIGDLLDVSRIQADRLELRLALVDLTQLVGEVVDEQRELQPDRVIRLELADGPVLVEADAERIVQVVVNFLTNALRYSPASQPVEVGVEVRERAARVWVRDHGPGIAPDEQGALWERFYRSSKTPVQTGSSLGLGLGLHISRTIVERHQGQVGIESVPGSGATFWFEVPLASMTPLDSLQEAQCSDIPG